MSAFEEVRNEGYLPYIQKEGEFYKDLPAPPNHESDGWSNCLAPNDRLFFHQTLASARKSANFLNFSSTVPKDSLDIILTSCYNQSWDFLGNKNDTVVQGETKGCKTFRRLKNTKDVEKIIPVWHPLKIGGVSQKISPHSIKLMNSGPHTPLTNPGYSRQTTDGNIFNY